MLANNNDFGTTRGGGGVGVIQREQFDDIPGHFGRIRFSTAKTS